MTLLNTDTGSTDPTDAVATDTVRKAARSVAAVGVSVGYGRRPVLSDVDVSIDAGETVGLRGPSGTGKTTLVRVLALLTRPQAGHVEIDGVPVRGVRHGVPAATRRRVAVLFQSPRAASDPRLSLYDIVAEPLRASGQAHLVAARVGALAEEVGLTADLLARKPHAVSDGQLQRACLARALAQRPDHLLCDEGTTMLDASTQAHLVAVVRRYQAASGAGVLAVSHDDALLHRWADRIVDLSGACGLAQP